MDCTGSSSISEGVSSSRQYLGLAFECKMGGAKYVLHLSHFCYMEGLPSPSRKSLGKEFAASSGCIAKASMRSLENGRPARSAFFCASSMAFIYFGTRGLFVQLDGSRRRSKIISALLMPLPCLARISSGVRVVTL